MEININNNIPNDIKNIILYYATNNNLNNLSNCSRVCKEWKKLLDNNLFWTSHFERFVNRLNIYTPDSISNQEEPSLKLRVKEIVQLHELNFVAILKAVKKIINGKKEITKEDYIKKSTNYLVKLLNKYDVNFTYTLLLFYTKKYKPLTIATTLYQVNKSYSAAPFLSFYCIFAFMIKSNQNLALHFQAKSVEIRYHLDFMMHLSDFGFTPEDVKKSGFDFSLYEERYKESFLNFLYRKYEFWKNLELEDKQLHFPFEEAPEIIKKDFGLKQSSPADILTWICFVLEEGIETPSEELIKSATEKKFYELVELLTNLDIRPLRN